MEKCLTCGADVPLHELPDHVELCSEKMSVIW